MALSVCSLISDQTNKELIEHGLTLFPIACYNDDLSTTCVPWHWHDEFEFIMMDEGEVKVQIENSEILLGKGNALFINSEVLHGIENKEHNPAKCHSLVFHAKLIGGSIESVFWQSLIAPILLDKSLHYICMNQSVPWEKKVIEHMAAAWQAITEETDDFENETRYHLSKAFRLMNENRSKVEIQANKKDQLIAGRAKVMIQYIENHFTEDISLEEIAASASLSKSGCLRCFKQLMGITPIRYLIQYRIEKASERLRFTNEKSNGIAISCGFSDISYFTKCFRQLKGMTPLEYRKNAR